MANRAITLADNTTQDAAAAITAAKTVIAGRYVIGMETDGSPTVTFDFLPDSADTEIADWYPIEDSSGAVSLTSDGAKLVYLPDCTVRAVVATAAATAWISPVDQGRV
jgi:hypothetical protein